MAENKTPEQLAREIELMERKNQKRREEIRAITATSAEMKELNGLLEVQHRLLSLSTERTEEQEKSLRKVEEQIVELLEAGEGQNKVLQEQIRLLKELIEAEEEDIKAKKEQQKTLQENAKLTEKFTQSIKSAVSAIDSFTGANFTMLMSLRGMGRELGNSAKSFEGVRSTLAVTTGFASKFNDEMYALASNKDIYLTVEQSGQAIGALSTRMADFNFLSKDTRLGLLALTGEFMNLGVAPETTADAMQLFTRGMGLQTDAVYGAVEGLRDLADATGQNLNVVVSSFNKMLPQLARYGLRSDQVFQKLTKQARAAGVEVSEVFQIEEMFDTYESAMATAGKLNAQFGLQINAMDIMGKEHGERLEEVRREILSGGVMYDQLNRREQQMLATIFKIDEARARSIFGDPIEADNFMKREKDRLAQSQKFVDATQKMAVAFQQLAISMEPALTGMMTATAFVADTMRGLFSTMTGVVVPITVGFGKLSMSLKIVAERIGDAGSRMSKLASGASKFFNVLGPIMAGVGGTIQGFSQGRDAGDAMMRGAAGGLGAYGGMKLALLMGAKPIAGATSFHPLAGLLAATLIGGAGALGGAYGSEKLYDYMSPAPTVNDGETLTNRSTRLIHNGQVSNVRSGEELRVGPIGSFAQQYRAMASMGSQEVTIKDNRPIKIVLPNGKVLAEAVMPGVTKAVGKKLNPMMA